MRKLVPALTALALGAAMVMSAGTPYELAARQLEINKSPAAEVIKIDAAQAAMFAVQERPALPPGFVLVLPESRTS